MKIARIKVKNFRGIKSADLLLAEHVVFVGDNNTGKSSLLEAIDLVLGPDRLRRSSPIDEHDFYAGEYISADNAPVVIKVEVTIVSLSEEQRHHFVNHIEFWDDSAKELIQLPPAERTDDKSVVPCLRVCFEGKYDAEDDNFVGETFFMSPANDEGEKDRFKTQDKRHCGFLFLRTLRTGSRALSLERGSLLDIILRLQDKRLTMWEDVLQELRKLEVAADEDLGITSILHEVQSSVRRFVPAEWGESPCIRVSDLTREHLRKTLTVFMGTGAKNSDGEEYSAPFHHQGTGTINTLVLALLAMIADLKQNVIFAMEEPEIAIPPHTQRQIVESVKELSAQSIFTSHSPYVLDEFEPKSLIILRRESGAMTANSCSLPPTVKLKKFRQELRTRFCECLLARRVLIVEGRTEYDAIPALARHLSKSDKKRFRALENLGIAVIDAETDTQVEPLGKYFRGLGKSVFAFCDKQDSQISNGICESVDLLLESPETSFEKLLLKHADESAIRRYALSLVESGDWPSHLADQTPSDSAKIQDLRKALFKFFKNRKGSGEAADFVLSCNVDELPDFLVSSIESITNICRPVSADDDQAEPEDVSEDDDELVE